MVLHTDSWREITRFIISGSRKVRICRKTAETEVTVTLNLNGEGCCSIKTGLSFFDHMLEQIARHAGVDLEIGVRGDLKVDEHHTVEDTAIVLGESLKPWEVKKESKDMVLLCLWTMQRQRYYSISAEGLGWNGGLL